MKTASTVERGREGRSSVGSVGQFGMLEDNDSLKTSEEQPDDFDIKDINDMLNATDELIKIKACPTFSVIFLDQVLVT